MICKCAYVCVYTYACVYTCMYVSQVELVDAIHAQPAKVHTSLADQRICICCIYDLYTYMRMYIIPWYGAHIHMHAQSKVHVYEMQI